MAVEIMSGISWFAPIFAFLLVMFIVYAVLKKTEVIGTNDATVLIVSFIVASFFILEAQLVNYVEFITGWAGAIVVIIFSFIFP